jgi:hypothetical protein
MIMIIKSQRWAGYIACMGTLRYSHRALVGKPEENRPLGRRRRNWEDKMKMDLRDLGRDVMTGFIWLRAGTSEGLLRTR